MTWIFLTVLYTWNFRQFLHDPKNVSLELIYIYYIFFYKYVSSIIFFFINQLGTLIHNCSVLTSGPRPPYVLTRWASWTACRSIKRSCRVIAKMLSWPPARRGWDAWEPGKPGNLQLQSRFEVASSFGCLFAKFCQDENITARWLHVHSSAASIAFCVRSFRA